MGGIDSDVHCGVDSASDGAYDTTSSGFRHGVHRRGNHRVAGTRDDDFQRQQNLEVDTSVLVYIYWTHDSDHDNEPRH